MSDTETRVGTAFSDCPDRDHDPYRVSGKPCHICQTEAMGARSVSIGRELLPEKEELRISLACLKAENTKLRATVETQAEIMTRNGCIPEAHAIIKKLRTTVHTQTEMIHHSDDTIRKLRAELAECDQEARALVAEVHRLQEEIRKLHVATSA